MIDKIKVINFLQDFGCAKLEHLQILFNDSNNNFKSILEGKMISKKGEIFVHNTKRIDEKMLIALDILCKYNDRVLHRYVGYKPVTITFLSKDNLLYHIIVANDEDKKGIVKLINDYPLSIKRADRLILAFPDEKELENIECDVKFLYTTYPRYEILNSYDR